MLARFACRQYVYTSRWFPSVFGPDGTWVDFRRRCRVAAGLKVRPRGSHINARERYIIYDWHICFNQRPRRQRDFPFYLIKNTFNM